MEAGLSTPAVSFELVLATDADALVAIRIAAMRESLERLGRFDPQRARERFLSAFDPACTRHIVVDGRRAGFVVARERDGGLLLDHLYLLPAEQGRGIGAAVMAWLLADADARGLAMRVGALRESAANRFYQRLGFVHERKSDWDEHYLRPARR